MANVTESDAVKRKSVPFTPKMDAALAAAYKEEKETIEGAFKGTKLTNKHKLEAWGRVRDCVNSVAGENEKTITQCKDRHRNLVQSITRRKYQVAATGGGSEPPPLTPAQQLLEGTLPKVKLEGIDGPLDTFKGSLISEEAKEASIQDLDADEGDQLLYMVGESVFQTLGEACRELEMRQMDTCIGKIEYKPKAGPSDVLCFKHYNAKEVVHGRTMEDWLRFSVCYWHTFRGVGLDPFGLPTIKRPWDDGSDSMENAKRRMRVAFEFFSKLGVKYWTFHDRDVAPEGATLEETNRNLDEITDLAKELMAQTGVKLLWNTCNLFANPRFMNGAATNPDAHVVAYAAAQVKKGLEIGKKLGAENFVFWGGREGYNTLLNTDVLAELTHAANFFKMAVAYKKKIGFEGQLLIEPKPKEPTRHQYDYDAMTVIGFLKHFGLADDFKINVEPNHTMLAGHSYEHDVVMASAFGMLGSIDSNTGSPDLGWDTDQFPMDVRDTTLVMKAVLEQDGLAPGALNFDAKVRRESTNLKDMFIAHIGAMDTFARGLRCAAKLVADGTMAKMVDDRYSSFKEGIGAKIEKGTATLEECENYVKKHGEPTQISGEQEKYECVLNHYV